MALTMGISHGKTTSQPANNLIPAHRQPMELAKKSGGFKPAAKDK